MLLGVKGLTGNASVACASAIYADRNALTLML